MSEATQDNCRFFGEWADEAEMLQSFGIYQRGGYVLPDMAGVRLLVVAYKCEGYEGDYCVLAVKDGKLLINTGGHCSCNNPEWDPDETTPEKVRADWNEINRDWGVCSLDGFHAALMAAVDAFEAIR